MGAAGVGVVAAMSVTVVCSCWCHWRSVGLCLTRVRRACWWPARSWVACVFLALRAAIGVLWVRGFLRHFLFAACLVLALAYVMALALPRYLRGNVFL